MNLPEFIYFDLGNVLLYFSRERQFCQMADALGISAAEVDQIVAKNDLMHRCETGKLSPEQLAASAKLVKEWEDRRPKLAPAPAEPAVKAPEPSATAGK